MAAFAYIAEFSQAFPDPNGIIQMAHVPPIVEQQLANTAGPVLSNVFNAATRYVRVHTDGIISIAFGKAPVAATTNMRLNANQTEYFQVNPGDRISIIANT